MDRPQKSQKKELWIAYADHVENQVIKLEADLMKTADQKVAELQAELATEKTRTEQLLRTNHTLRSRK